jgi:hypothetical protein
MFLLAVVLLSAVSAIGCLLLRRLYSAKIGLKCVLGTKYSAQT